MDEGVRAEVAAQARKAARALLEFAERQAGGGKAALFDGEDDGASVNLVLALRKAPQGRTVPLPLPVPRSLLAEDAEICLIVKDDTAETRKALDKKQANATADANVAALEERVAAMGEGACGVSKVIGIRRLKSDYKQFEQRRQLLARYDMFLCDERVVGVLPKLLGSKFFKKKRQPIPVRLEGKKDWSKQFQAARNAAYLHLSRGSCSMVKVARTSWTEDAVVANTVAALDASLRHIPKKWKGLQAIYLKTEDSVALPIWCAAPEAGAIAADVAAAEDGEAKAKASKRKAGAAAAAGETTPTKKKVKGGGAAADGAIKKTRRAAGK